MLPFFRDALDTRKHSRGSEGGGPGRRGVVPGGDVVLEEGKVEVTIPPTPVNTQNV